MTTITIVVCLLFFAFFTGSVVLITADRDKVR